MQIKNDQIKLDFPILSRQVNVNPLVYLDNAATSQKPHVVIDAITNYYTTSNANIHRGVHTLSDESTILWDKSRATIADFFGAKPEELIITRNTTEAINGVAYGWADHNLQTGDVILTTFLDHHANIVTWQEVCKRTGAELKFIELNPDGTLNLNDFEAKLKQFSPKLIALPHISNTLGVVVPIPQVVVLTKKYVPQARILVDAAQSAPHIPINFHDLDVDFLVFSGHKMLGPMGVGGLLVRFDLLKNQEMHPWLFGGGMISSVLPEKSDFNSDISDRFTAGTPDVASVVGLATACQYLQNIGMENVLIHDLKLVNYALEKLSQVPEIELVGPTNFLLENNSKTPQRVGSVAFIYQGVHAHDVAQILDSEGVAVRSGHHCCMPLHQHFGWQATVRVSFQIYNSKSDVDALIDALKKVKSIFGQ